MTHATMDLPALRTHPAAARRCRPSVRHACGTTVMELMTTLAVVGVLLGAAVPGFASVIERNRNTTVSNRLLTTLARARNEAVTHASGAVVCPSADAISCLPGHDFSRGWLGFRDVDSDGALDPGEWVFTLTQASDLHGRRVFATAGRRSLRYRADGRNAGTNLTLRVCDESGVAQRVVIVSVGGRARIGAAPPGTAPCPLS